MNVRQIYKQYEAYRRSLKVWAYLADNPDCTSKHNMPSKLYRMVLGDIAMCPLCTIYASKSAKRVCTGCPLKDKEERCYTRGQPYYNWSMTRNLDAKLGDVERLYAAHDVLYQIKAWRWWRVTN